MIFFIGNHVIGTGFQSSLKHLVGIGGSQRILNKADTLKIKGNGTALAHNAAAFSENRAYISRRTVFIVRQSLYDNRDFSRTKTFITCRYKIVAALVRAGFRNCPLNIVFWHTFGTGSLNGQTQTRIFVRFRKAALGSNGNITGQFCKNLGFFGVLSAFTIHNVLKLGVSRHCINSFKTINSGELYNNIAAFARFF